MDEIPLFGGDVSDGAAPMTTARRFSGSELAFGVVAAWLVSLLFWAAMTVFVVNLPALAPSSFMEVWLVVFGVNTVIVVPVAAGVGVPFAMWVERRFPGRSSVYGPYVFAGATIGVVFMLTFGRASLGGLVSVAIVGLAVICAVAGRWGAGLWQRRRLRRAEAAIVGADG